MIGLIGNEIRLKLLWLFATDDFCVCDLADILQMSVPAVSQHLRKLKDLDIIHFNRKKQTLFYYLAPANKKLVLHILELFPETKKINYEIKVS